MLVVLPTLTPAERVAFVLHGLFDLPFEEIAPVVGRTPPAAVAVAETFAGRARAARPALIGGDIGLVSAPGGTPRGPSRCPSGPDSIVGIELIADPESLERLDPVLLPTWPRHVRSW